MRYPGQPDAKPHAEAADPTGRKNRIRDPKYAADVAELSKKLLAHVARTDDPQTKASEAAIAGR